MNLLLVVETSSNEYRIVLGRDRKPVFDSTKDRNYSTSTDLATIVSSGLRFVNAEAREIEGIALNIGPGGLTSTRAGASFVNALAFSLGIPIYPFSYFEIIANQTQQLTKLPVICAIPAANDHAYVALTRGASVEVMRFGLLPSVVAEITNNLKEIAIAGRIRPRVSSLLSGVNVLDTGVEQPDPLVIMELAYKAHEREDASAKQVSPLNDQSEIFYG